MADRTLARASERFDVLARRIAAAAPGNPVSAAASLSEAEFGVLADLAGDPRRILVAGPGAAHAGMMLAQAHPLAEVVAIDPDIRPEDSAEVSRLIDLHGRLREETGPFASAVNGKRPIGPEICASEEDFDLILIDGAADSASRAADLRLAASAVAPGGLIAMRGVMGRSAATVRAGVFEFLRFNWGFHYLAVPTPGSSAGLGLLRSRAAGWFHGVDAPAPVKRGEVSDALLAGLSEQIVAMAGAAPLVEASIGVPLLDDARRNRDGDVLLHVSPAEAAASYVDPAVGRMADALNGGVLFTGDLADFASDELLTRLFDRLADRNAAGIFAVTPPGEKGVAGPASRPAARLIDLAASQGLAAYAPAGLEFETVRHADAQAAVSSRHLSLLMFAKPGGRRDGAGRLLVERTPAAAAQHEQVELQRLIDQSALRADVERHSAERERAETREQDVVERLKNTTRALDIANDAHDRARRAWDADHGSLREELRTQTDLAVSLKDTLDKAEATLLREHKLRQDFETDTLRRIKALETELEQLREASRIEADRLRWDMAAADAREQAARERLGESRDEIAELHDQLRTAQGALKSLGESDSRHRQRAEAAEGRIAAALAQANELKAQHARTLAQAERDTSRIRMSLADEVSRGQRLLTDAQASAAEAERLRAELKAAADRYAQLALERAALLETQTQGAAALSSTDAERQRLAAELTSAREAHAAEATRLRSDHASEMGRVRQAALTNAARPEDLAELKALREGKARLEADIEARRRDVAEMQKRLSQAGQQAIDQACREIDLQASLAGVDAHLALSQDAVEHVRRDPTGYRLAHQTYPEGAPIVASQDGGSRDLIETAHALHGRAADLSRDIGKTLEAAELRRNEALEAIRTSHQEALTRASGNASAGEAERTLDRIADIAAANERTVRGIEATALGADAPPLGSSSGVGAEARLRDHGQRLEHVLHRLEAGPPPAVAFEPTILPDAEPLSEPVQLPVHIEPPVVSAAPAAKTDERPFAILPTLDGPIKPAIVAPAVEAPEPQRKIIDDLSPEPQLQPKPKPRPAAKDELVMSDAVGAPGQRPVTRRAWDWLRAYRETFDLVRLQRTLDSQYARGRFRAKIFDADYYRSQGPIPAGQDALQHYLLIGEAQGRRPLYGFDPAFYRSTIGDLDVRGSLLRHFIEIGVDDGFSPSAELEPIARRALAAGQSRLEYFLRREEETRRMRITAGAADRR